MVGARRDLRWLMDANYRIKRNAVTGAETVHFKCVHCGSPLVFYLPDAGETAPCPSCGEELVVPGGAKQVAELKAEADANREAAAKRAAFRKRMAARMEKIEREGGSMPYISFAAPQIRGKVDAARQGNGPKRVADMTGLELRRVIEGAMVRSVVAILGLALVVYVLWNIATAIGRMAR